MPTTTIRAAAIAAAIALAQLTAAAQNPSQPTPTSQTSTPPNAAAQSSAPLQQAATVLNSIDSRAVSGDTARKLQTLRQDFAALQTAYNEQMLNGPAGNTAPGAMSTAGEKDWHIRYSVVDSDLRDLIGTEPPGGVGSALPATGAADLDPRMREQLQQFRTSLANFYAGTLGPTQPNAVTQPPAAPAPTPGPAGQPPAPTLPPANSSAADLHQTSDVMALLNRIEEIVNQALKATPATASAKPAPATPVGTTGTLTVNGAASNKVSIERDKLDEIRAEIQQLKVILKK